MHSLKHLTKIRSKSTESKRMTENKKSVNEPELNLTITKQRETEKDRQKSTGKCENF